MTWTGYKLWHCEVCDQHVEGGEAGFGPWCDLYCGERRMLCWAYLKRQLRRAHETGDGPLVNALRAYGRRAFGQDLDW